MGKLHGAYKQIFSDFSRGLISYNDINSQLDATITNLFDNYNQLSMFRAIILPILRSTRLCLQLMV